jgi:hypothetical protein
MSLDYLPGTASLLEELDKRLMVLLRDGRTLIGYLRFQNLIAATFSFLIKVK